VSSAFLGAAALDQLGLVGRPERATEPDRFTRSAYRED
jgi:hypothetical protein